MSDPSIDKKSGYLYNRYIDTLQKLINENKSALGSYVERFNNNINSLNKYSNVYTKGHDEYNNLHMNAIQILKNIKVQIELGKKYDKDYTLNRLINILKYQTQKGNITKEYADKLTKEIKDEFTNIKNSDVPMYDIYEYYKNIIIYEINVQVKQRYNQKKEHILQKKEIKKSINRLINNITEILSQIEDK